jgi:capsular polysaccharide biosynthesis protein
MTEEILDVRSMLRILWRFRLLLAATAAAGALLGVAYALASPPLARSSALVLLPPSPANSGDQGTHDPQTQVAIATSTPVLAQAGRQVTPHTSASALRRVTSAKSVTQDIIEVGVSAPTTKRASELTDAVAVAYVDYVRDAAQQLTNGAIEDLQKTESSLTDQIEQLQSEIKAATRRLAGESASSEQGRQDASLIANLRGVQSDLSTRLDDVRGQVDDLHSQGNVTTGSTARVLQPATVAHRSTIGHAVWMAIEFCLALLLLVSIIVVTVARRDRRLRSRDEIADAIGQSVLGSIEARPRRDAGAWRALLTSYRPSTTENWALRKLLRQLRVADEAEGCWSLTVLSLASDPAALAVGPQVAGFIASLGIPTDLVLAGYHDTAATLWASCAPSSATPQDLPPNLSVVDPDAEAREGTVRVVVVVVDVENVRLSALAPGTTAILAISAGVAAADELARLAVACDDAERGIDGVVVVNPDQRDRTTGFSPRHHGAAVALPTRITGVAGGAR